MKLLIEHGVDVKSGAGARALETAVEDDAWDVVKLLIEHGLGSAKRSVLAADVA